jgi:hypothetical protein
MNDAPSLVAMLSWSDDGTEAAVVHNAYLDRLATRLGAVVQIVRASDPELARELSTATMGASPVALQRVLTAPETAHRLLALNLHVPVDVAMFLLVGFDMERDRKGGTYGALEENWSAVGDFGVAAEGRSLGIAQVANFVALDVGSPHSATLDEFGRKRDDVARPNFTRGEIDHVIERFQSVRDELQATSHVAFGFVRLLTKVVIPMKFPGHSPASGSNGEYIGRTFLVNPQSRHATTAYLANALVHEAIHAALYMADLDHPWFHDQQWYDDTPRTISPWSGRHLSLWTFLQACFVWFGLAHFWLHAKRVGTFAPELVDAHLDVAARGFIGPSISEQLKSYRGVVASALMTAVEELQDRIADSHGAEGFV